MNLAEERMYVCGYKKKNTHLVEMSPWNRIWKCDLCLELAGLHKTIPNSICNYVESTSHVSHLQPKIWNLGINGLCYKKKTLWSAVELLN